MSLIFKKYGGVNAKIMAMRGKLLKYSDYYALAQFKTVKDVSLKLMEYPAYSPALSSLDDISLHREPVEQRLLLSLADDFARIHSFVGDRSLRYCIEAFILRNEINVLNHLLNSIYDSRHVIPYTMLELNRILGKELHIDIPKLISSKSVTEFIENLKGTVFYGVLSKKYADDMPSLFELEFELDLYYYLHLHNLRNKNLDRANKKAIGYINGVETDIRNIMWIYRLKRFYKIPEKSIYLYLIPVHYRISKSSLLKMADAKSIEELEAEIDNSPYAEVFSDKGHIERGMYLAMNKTFRRAQMMFGDSFAPALAYIYSKETEIRNLTSLIEGVRYSLSHDIIMKHIIIGKSGGAVD